VGRRLTIIGATVLVWLAVAGVFVLVVGGAKSGEGAGGGPIFGPRVAIVELEGIITDVDEIVRDLKTHRENPSVRAVVIRINSPGGVVGPTQELVERLRTRVKVEGKTAASTRDILREELLTLVDPTLDRALRVDRADDKPGVVLVVGVNGTGKTTTVGKLARVLVAEDKHVVLGAADTFRAAAAEQLATWGERVGVHAVRGPEGSDPASVAFEAVKTGTEEHADVVIVDTAGRLQNKAGLMDELGKVKRVLEKQAAVSEVLLVLDATTGQNGLVQARVFREVVDVTGIVLTKLDGSAKGGIVVAVQRELGVPVKLVGLGEGADDLAPFDAETFVDALLGGA